MKKRFLSWSLLLLCAFSAQAQQKVYIQLNDTTIERYVWEVVDITFGTADYELESSAPAASEAIDLGLSVKWAPVNLEATTSNPDFEGETFTHFGWGDVTGVNKSDQLRYFPVLHPTTNILNDNTRDIATKLWGDKWRLPSDKEVKELIEKCEWIWDETNYGYRVIGPNDNEIFLPALGSRYLNDIPNAQTEGHYWTGVYNKSDDETAYSLSFDQDGKELSDTTKRFFGLAIRPVYGDQAIEVISSTEMRYYRGSNESVYYDEATFQVTYTVTGDADKVDEHGVLYGKSGAKLEYDAGCSVMESTSTLDTGENVEEFVITGLDEGGSYKVRPYTIVEGVPVYGAEVAFTTSTRFPEPNYVDMGVSVRWAAWDVGAPTTDDFGVYVGWGDATGELISTNAYDYATGFTGMSIAGNAKYDIARAKWGKKWRMPTEAELLELAENCTWVREERTSPTTGLKVSGYLVTSKISKNSIFLPAGGYYQGTQSDRVNSYVLLWTADLDTETHNPIYYRWTAGSPLRKVNTKEMRTLIRAVYDLPTDPDNYGGGTVTPDDPDVPVTPDDPTPEDPITPKVTPGTAVDLGLSSGTKWANYNLGATSETDAGYYIAWADTIAREDYSRANYLHYEDGKYLDLGKVFNANNDYTLDAARYIWGGTWRVPTEVEMSELWMECTWTWTTKNGIPGFTVTGPNKKSIFLPAVGYKSGATGSIKQEGRYGYYWTSTVNLRNTDYGLQLKFNSESTPTDVISNPMPGTYREWGLSIRPVCK